MESTGRKWASKTGNNKSFSLSKEIGKIGAAAAASGTVGSSKTQSNSNLMEEISLAFDFRTRECVGKYEKIEQFRDENI